MPSAWIDLIYGTISLNSKRLDVTGMTLDENDLQIEVRRSLPLLDLERLSVSEAVTLSGPAVAALLRKNIPVAIIANYGESLLGSIMPASPAHAQWRMRQYACTIDPEFSLHTAKLIIAAKIYNQRRTLQRLALSREQDVAATLQQLGHSIAQSTCAQNPSQLLGIEGNASASFYKAWATFLPEDFPFEKRSRRPPLNPVNAVLSYTSSILYHEVTTALHTGGLDPGLGLLHTTENGRWALALDLMEPYRPVIVEPIALDLFSRGILQGKHFTHVEGGIHLNAHGRKRLILQYEKRLEREFLSEHRGLRTTLRAQIQQDAAQLKASLERADAFQPFRIN